MDLLRTKLLPGFLARRRVVAVGAAGAIGIAAFAGGWGGGLDHLLQDGRDAVRARNASGEIHIVEIDARSLAVIARWPWPRSVHASVIDRLRQAGARSIAFDVDFSAPSDPAQDAQLAGALARARGSVILPTFRQAAGSGASSYVDNVPIKPLADHAFLAAVNVVPDGDGYVRPMPLGVETAGVPRPSLASMVAEADATIGHEFEVDNSLDPASIPRHSVIDLLRDQVPASALAGKRIVIGATAVEMGDRYAVPRHGVIPGVVIQAMAAETLLTGPVPQRWSAAWMLGLAFLLIVASVMGGSRKRRIVQLVVGSALLVGAPLATEALFAIHLPFAPALAALLVFATLAAAALVAERYRARDLVDADTGLPNLAALEEAVSARNANVVVARIDRFAAIASGLGPAATATLVGRVAERLAFANAERIVYRTDDASLAWLEEPSEEAGIDGRLDGIAAVMRSPVECGRLVDVSLCFGVARRDGASAKQLVSNAALAASHAARNGTRYETFCGASSDETDWHLSLLGELDTAMASGELWNAYQPKLCLRTGNIIGVEALVRWRHAERGPISPDRFIPLVEEHGRARDLTTHVLAQALRDAELWAKLGHPIGVAVNVSATLLCDHGFIEQVGETLRASPVPADRVTIEVTESAAMNTPERAIAALESWRALGVAISIDDYGTGQSSLGYLQKLPATELKIDKSFVQTIGSDRRNAIMVRSTIALAHELGMKVVAEGIEDEACLLILTEIGCDTAQGYHIAKPLASEDVVDFLSRDRALAA